MKAWLGIVAGILFFAAHMEYIRAIVQKGKRPNRTTWWIWVVVTGLIFFSLLKSHAAIGALFFTGAITLSVSIIAILSLKYGESSLSWLDVLCLLLALEGMNLWYFTSDVDLGFYSFIVGDIVGFIPTIFKAYRRPQSEDLAAWVEKVFASALNLFACSGVNSNETIFSGYTFVGCSLIVYLLVIGKERAEGVKK